MRDYAASRSNPGSRKWIALALAWSGPEALPQAPEIPERDLGLAGVEITTQMRQQP
jgi:hypothetical protein